MIVTLFPLQYISLPEGSIYTERKRTFLWRSYSIEEYILKSFYAFIAINWIEKKQSSMQSQ